MHYLIFIPNKSAPNSQHLIDAGLGDLLRDGDETPMCADLTGAGPGGLPGQVWAWGNAIPAYLPERQTWTAEPRGRFWIGIDNGSSPTPDDLLRRNHVGGLYQEMADGQVWTLPNVFRLPAVFAEDPTGLLLKVPHQRYSAFVTSASWALDACLNVLEGEMNPDWAKAVDFVVQALSLNYRINRQIALALGLLEEELLFSCMAKCTDTARIFAIQQDLAKKNGASTLTG